MNYKCNLIGFEVLAFLFQAFASTEILSTYWVLKLGFQFEP